MKRSPLYRMLLFLALILLVGILLETRDGSNGAAGDNGDAAAVTMPIAAAAGDNAAVAPKWASAILDRPLFRMDRRPASGDAAAAGVNPGAPSGMPRLAGIIMSGGIRLAVFQSGGAIKPVALREGAQVGPYTIESIRPQRVVVRGIDGTSVLKPRPDAPANGQPAADAAQPSALPIAPIPDAPPPAAVPPPDTSNPAAYNIGPMPSFEGSNPEVPRYRSPAPPLPVPPPNVP